MTIQERLNKIIKAEGTTPCISLIVPLIQTMPGRDQNIIRLRDISKQASAHIATSNNKGEQDLAKRLAHIIETIDINQFSTDGIAILIGAQHHEIIPLNGPCTPKFHVGTLLALEDVIRGTQNSTDFWVLIVGKQYARLFSRNHHSLTEIITPLKDSAGQPLQGFPLNILPPEDKFKQAAGTGDRGDSYFNAEVKRFFQLVDSELQKVITAHGHMPVILCGTPEYVKLFKETTHHPDKIAFDIPRDYDAHQKAPVHLKKDIADAIDLYHNHEEQSLLHEFEEAANTRRQACGITYVWEMASTSRVQKLLIEPDLSEVGRIDPENPAHLQIFPQKTDSTINNIADLLIYETLRHGGTVHIVKPGTLKQCEGVGAIMRY